MFTIHVIDEDINLANSLRKGKLHEKYFPLNMCPIACAVIREYFPDTPLLSRETKVSIGSVLSTIDNVTYWTSNSMEEYIICYDNQQYVEPMEFILEEIYVKD